MIIGRGSSVGISAHLTMSSRFGYIGATMSVPRRPPAQS